MFDIYPLAKKILFRLEPEKVHHWVIKSLHYTEQMPAALRLLQGYSQGAPYTPSAAQQLSQKLFGLTFPHPIMLAAGLDKDAVAVRSWQALGFGAVEVGSVTRHAQAGNAKPRLFRLSQYEALINRFGFNNQGADAMRERLATLRQSQQLRVPLGVNVGKSKITPLEQAASDYEYSLKALSPYADYVVINVSSPNTAGLRDLQHADYLRELLATCLAASDKPLLIKIAPDLSWAELDDMLSIIHNFRVAGIIATNTTLERSAVRGHRHAKEAGGLSGRPLRERSLEFLQHLRPRTHLPIISVGGIMTGEDMYQRLRAGANLVQVYTGFVYRGPLTVKYLLEELHNSMRDDGIRNLRDIMAA